MYETVEVNQCRSVVADMGQWCSAVGAGVEQGRQRGMRLAIFDLGTDSALSRHLEIKNICDKSGFTREWLKCSPPSARAQILYIRS